MSFYFHILVSTFLFWLSIMFWELDTGFGTFVFIEIRIEVYYCANSGDHDAFVPGTREATCRGLILPFWLPVILSASSRPGACKERALATRWCSYLCCFHSGSLGTSSAKTQTCTIEIATPELTQLVIKDRVAMVMGGLTWDVFGFLRAKAYKLSDCFRWW